MFYVTGVRNKIQKHIQKLWTWDKSYSRVYPKGLSFLGDDLNLRSDIRMQKKNFQRKFCVQETILFKNLPKKD